MMMMGLSVVVNKNLNLAACVMMLKVVSERKREPSALPLAVTLLLSFDLCFLWRSRYLKVARELKKKQKNRHVSYSSVGTFFDVVQVIVMP